MHHLLFALVTCPFCSIFILFCSKIHYHLYQLFALSLFHLLLFHCPILPQPCRLCIVCTTSIHPSSTLYLLLPVFFYPITNILPLMPPLFQFLFPFPLFSLFPFLLVFLCTDVSPMKMKRGKIRRSQVRCPPLPIIP